jgi:hypothetical protein
MARGAVEADLRDCWKLEVAENEIQMEEMDKVGLGKGEGACPLPL